MSSLISLGSFNTTNGRTTGLGLASGLDSNALIEAILQARVDVVTETKDLVTGNTEKIAAVNTLNTLLERLKTVSDFLRAPPGVRNEDGDFFKHATSSLSSSTTTAASTYLSVVAESGATVNSYIVDDITIAKAQILRKDGFTSDSTSVVGNVSITDNYQVSLGTVAGTTLNTTTPITFANDINNSSALLPYSSATAATLDLVFSSENLFNAADNITFGSTSITFGGTGGNDIDISAATTLDQKIAAIVTRMNAVASGDESFYTYSSPSSGVLRLTRDTAGPIATAGRDINVSAIFSSGADATQRVGIGKIYENNGSASGSVALSNGAVSGSVSSNGVDGVAASSQATISVVFANNLFDSTLDRVIVGGTTLTFGGGGNDDITVGGSLQATLVNIANRLNAKTTGEEAGYNFTVSGANTLVITRDVYGAHAAVDTNLDISADLSLNGTDTTNTVAIGNLAATNLATAGTVNGNGTDGVSNTAIANTKTIHTTSLSGAVTFPAAPVFTAGSSDGLTFTSNYVTFKATVGGATYTSRPVNLDGGNVTGTGTGDGGLGNRIASGTVITFVKDSQTDTTAGTKDVTFQLVVGAEATVTAASLQAYQDSFGTFLNTTNTITITQNPAVPAFRAGVFTLGGVDITLTEGDTLKSIKASINAVQATSGVVADIVQLSETSYSLILKSTETGLINRIVEYGNSEAGDAPTGTIQFGADNVAFTEQQAANDASFRLDGLTITRATNSIDDVIDKLTFTLLSSTGAADPTLTVNINHDAALVKSGVTDFINAYNELKFFIARQNKRDENNVLAEDAVLGDESILRNVITAVEAQLSSLVGGIAAGDIKSLAAVGIDRLDFPGDDTTPKTTGIFVLNEATFDSALAADFEKFRRVFANNFTANSSDIGLFAPSNKATLTNFKLDIDTSRTETDRVRVLNATTNAVLFNMDINVSTGAITGKTGTALEGLRLVYTGDGVQTITVNYTQGILSKLFNTVSGFLAETNGIIDTTIAEFTKKSTSLQDLITKDNIQIEIERQLLVERFTNLESVVASANNVLSFLEAQRNSNNSANN